MLSFDITDRNIRIIKGVESNGKIRISSAATLDLEEEVIINGHVKDVPRLATLINQVLRTNKMADKEAIVSISSNLTIFKELHIPKTKDQDFVKMVRAEMQSALNLDDSYSVSYVVVGDSNEGEEGAQKVLATACPYEVVDCYKRVFSMLTISLRSVMIGCNCITKVLLSDVKIKSKMPLLAVQIDNNFISLNLYEKGQLSFSRFASISAEDYGNSDDYVFEAVNENIFRMLQFQKSKNTQEIIENVVFYGDTHEFVRLTNSLEQMGIRTSIITVPPQIHGYENLEFSSYANAIGAMFKRNKDLEHINLLQTDTVNNNKIKTDKSYYALLALAVGGSLALMLGIWGFLALKNNGIEKDTEELQAKIDSDDTKKKQAQLEMLRQREQAVKAYQESVQDAYDAFHTKPYVLQETYTLIEDILNNATTKFNGENGAALELLIENFEYFNGEFKLDLTCDADEDPTQTLPSVLVAAMREEESFYYASYEGYSLLSEGAAGEAAEIKARWSMTVKIKGDPLTQEEPAATEAGTDNGEEGDAE